MSSTLDGLRQLVASSSLSGASPEVEVVTPKKDKKSKKLPKFLDSESHTSIDDPKLLLDDLDKKLAKYGGLQEEDFDALIDTIDVDDEDLELKSALIGMGRKYARTNAVSESENEIDRAFAANEQELRNILAEMHKDSAKLEKDLENLRGTGFNRSVIKTAELAGQKTSLHTARVSVLKELNNIAKTKIELKAKLDKNVGGTDESLITNNIMQQLFGMGHQHLIGDVGGREEFSGADYDEDDNDSMDDIGEQYCEDYDSKRAGNDGDKYLKYEGQHVDLVAEFNTSTEDWNVYAVDQDGEPIPDYPVPENPNDIQFEINYRANTAVDHLQRHYIYKEI